LDALEALARLREGNARFAANVRSLDSLLSQARRGDLVAGQNPFAIILGCSDSRAPAEIVFDQGLGDLFVIRVAGNIVAPSQIGSVEFAASRFGTRLVVVLGHSNCGAVSATLEELTRPRGSQSRHLESIVNRVRPAVEPLLEGLDITSGTVVHFDDALIQRAVRANVRVASNQLRNSSEILEDLIEHHGLLIVGAEYSLETGLVDFFEGAPAPSV